MLVVVDTVSRALAGGDENSPGDMGAIVCSLDRLRDEFNCHVLAVHHLGKDATRGARGHSRLTCNLDTVIEVTRDEASKISSAVIKNQRDGPLGGQFDFQMRPVELGRDEDLDPVTSCVVEAAGGDTPTPRPKHVPLSAKLQNRTRHARQNHRRPWPAGTAAQPYPNHRNCRLSRPLVKVLLGWNNSI